MGLDLGLADTIDGLCGRFDSRVDLLALDIHLAENTVQPVKHFLLGHLGPVGADEIEKDGPNDEADTGDDSKRLHEMSPDCEVPFRLRMGMARR